jgi:hypothetical protein
MIRFLLKARLTDGRIFDLCDRDDRTSKVHVGA